MTPAQITNDQYAENLLFEAARLLSIHCPRCARARLRRIARHDAETTGVDYEEALRNREIDLEDLTSQVDFSKITLSDC